VELIDRIIAGDGRNGDAVESLPQMRNARAKPRSAADEVQLLRDLCDTMKFGSLCALGGFTPYPVLSALDHFPEDFGHAPMQQAAE
jgi:formate dehydrogenase iron-sulfur subunit